MSAAATSGVRRRSDAIDLVKALAILGMLAQHTIPGSELSQVGRDVWIRPAVPVFFVIAGMNLLGSWQRRGSEAGVIAFLARRLDRIVGPFVLILAVDYVIAAARGSLHPTASWVLGALPIDAPGNYFVTAFVGIVILFPLVAAAFRRRPALTLAACLVLDAAVEYVLLHHGNVAARLRGGPAPYWFPAFPLRYLGAVALGMWIAVDRRLLSRRNLAVVALAVPSFAFLLALDLGANPLGWFPDSYEKAMSVFAAPWALLLVMLGLRLLPADVGRNPVGRAMVEVGRASWHVYLVQMVWIGAVAGSDRSLSQAPLHIAVCLLLGWLFYRLVPRTPLPGRVREPAPAGVPTGTPPAPGSGS